MMTISRNAIISVRVGAIIACLLYVRSFSPLPAAPNGIVPGRSIGQIRLGEPAAQATAPLGKPQKGDAAMGHFWGVWMPQSSIASNRSELDVLTKRDKSGLHEFVEQVRITSPWFTTAQGIRVGSSRAAILAAYPDARLVRQGNRPTKFQSLILYDSARAGITFEFPAGGNGTESTRCQAIVVHPKRQSVLSEYYPWYLPDDNGMLHDAL